MAALLTPTKGTSNMPCEAMAHTQQVVDMPPRLMFARRKPLQRGRIHQISPVVMVNWEGDDVLWGVSGTGEWLNREYAGSEQ